MAKDSGPECGGKTGPLSLPSQNINTTKGLSRNDLCVLCLLSVDPLVFNPGGWKGREGLISI
jgi:hypothetical protein